MTHIDRIDIFDELHDFARVDIFAEPAAELRREIVLAVGKGARPAKASHDAAGIAADAALDLAGRDGTDPMIDVVAALEDDDGKAGLFFRQLIGCKDSRRTRAHNGDIILFHAAVPPVAAI